MKKAISLGLLGLTAWVFFMLVHLPASFVYQMAPVPANVSASNITGTVWSGKVGVLTVDNVSLTSVNWSLKPIACWDRHWKPTSQWATYNRPYLPKPRFEPPGRIFSLKMPLWMWPPSGCSRMCQYRIL